MLAARHVHQGSRQGQRREIGLIQLFGPARKDQGDLPRALIDERNLLLDNDVAEPAQLRCQSFRFSGQRLKFDLGRNDAVDRNQKAALVNGGVRFVMSWPILIC